MLAQHYSQILHLHVACVILSGAMFVARGFMRQSEMPLANHRALRFASYVIDTALLTAAILPPLIIRQFPLTHTWLTVRVALLLIYIVIGSLALNRARTRRGRLVSFLAALATYVLIISIAVTHDPLGALRWFGEG